MDLPAWSGDETLYSWCSGFHMLHGGTSAKATGELLFGKPNACKVRDIPTDLAFLDQATQGRLGCIERVLEVRTVFGAYQSTLTSQRYGQVVGDLLSGRGRSAKLVMGLTAGRAGATHPLRYCRSCLRNDEDRIGRGRWRRPHQLPGAYVCLDHHERLLFADESRSTWLLPSSTVPYLPQDADAYDSLLTRLTAVSAVVCSLKKVDWPSVARASVEAISRIGIPLGTLSWLRQEEADRWLSGTELYRWSIETGAYSEIMRREGAIGEMLHERRAKHPMRLTLLWLAAHESWETAELLKRLQWAAAGGATMRGQGDLWPNLCGGSGRRAPPAMYMLVEDGIGISEIAQRMQVSRATVRRWMDADPLLQTRWRKKHFDAHLHRVIDELADYARTAPSVTRSAMLKDQKTACEWLRRNAPEHLRGALEVLPARHERQGKLFSED